MMPVARLDCKLFSAHAGPPRSSWKARAQRGHAGSPVHVQDEAQTHKSHDGELATPGDNGIHHTVRALHSHPGP